jgi:hypothetical protein
MPKFAVTNAAVSAINTLMWSGLSWMGWCVLKGVEGQHVTGYPDHVQFNYYFGFPLSMLVCSLVLYSVAGFTRFRVPALLTQFLVFFVVFPFLFFYTGGV